ncbi:MAG TPA: cation-translocating P-type ATPase [Bellilinea sp.]|nr:cation-translocating P-type ATPase [Bellilinea sp.]
MNNPKQSPSNSPANQDLNAIWHALSHQDVLARLGSEQSRGLTTTEAARRLEEFGLNQLTEPPHTTFLQMVVRQLNDFVVILLIVAAVVSTIVSAVENEPYIESIAILAIVVLNAVLGVVQESRAEQALAALKKLAAPDAQVLRDGHRVSVPAHQLVPGDIVFLEAGNFIPADLRLMEAVNLRVEEAALTGESVPVEKNAVAIVDANSSIGDRKNTAFMGTLAAYGRGRGVVVGTGMRTQLGMIATMLQSVEMEQTPLQRRLQELGKTLGWAALIICALVFVAGIIQGGPLLEMFMVAVSLAIAAVPEGLPAIVTISLALGMREMVKRHALIRRLSSVETLGSATVICSDKTGTLTQNVMTVTRLWVDGQDIEISGSGYSADGTFSLAGSPIDLQQYPAACTALWVGALNNDAELERLDSENGRASFRIIGDPTEGAILIAAAKAGGLPEELNQAYPREREIPFDSDRKRMVTVHGVKQPRSEDLSPFSNGDLVPFTVVVKGAPDVVLKLCSRYQTAADVPAPLDGPTRSRINAANEALTQDALRVLGMAYRVLPQLPEKIDHAQLEEDLVFVGLVGMIDPARPEVQPALEKAAHAGIRTIMITGDYPNTARAIAESIHLLRPGHQVLAGAQLDEMDDAALQVAAENTDVFARVSPEHKMRIVDALKANGEVVAMTGDGVNDAPAIKRADIGVAMGITGTDVAKGAADMVLTDDNYASIVSAVEQGRIIYANIRKFVYYLISCNLAEILIIFIPTAFGRLLFPNIERAVLSPLAPIQLLWLNLITDGAPALALGTEKGDPDTMEQQPRPPKEPIINKSMRLGVIIQTIAITAVTLTAYAIGLLHNEIYAETMAFLTLSLSELLRAFTARSEHYPILKIGLFTNKWMNLAVLFSLTLLILVVYVPFLNPIFSTVPLTWTEWRYMLPLLIIPSLAAEAGKYVITGRAQRRRAAN